MPSPSLPALSEHAEHVDVLFHVLEGIAVAGTALVWGALALAIARRNRRRPDEPPKDRFAASAACFVVLLAVYATLFHLGFAQSLATRVVPPGALIVRASASRFSWAFEHENGFGETNELHLPVGVPIRLELTSSDVVHSFYVPELRLRAWAIPGRVETITFTLAKEGTTATILCGEYCGTRAPGLDRNTGHSTMQATLYALSRAEYAHSGTTICPPAPSACDDLVTDDGTVCRGRRLVRTAGCIACHSEEPLVNEPGPSLAGFFGRPRPLEHGGTILADDEYVATSIRHPQLHIVRGYTSVTMPPYRLSETQVEALTAYFRAIASTTSRSPPPPRSLVAPVPAEEPRPVRAPASPRTPRAAFAPPRSR